MISHLILFRIFLMIDLFCNQKIIKIKKIKKNIVQTYLFPPLIHAVINEVF